MEFLKNVPDGNHIKKSRLFTNKKFKRGYKRSRFLAKKTYKRKNVISKERKELELSIEDKDLIKPYISDIKCLLVYETSKIKEILVEIDSQKSEPLQKWVQKIKESMYSMNEERYWELSILYSNSTT